jgi:hypothetical protein
VVDRLENGVIDRRNFSNDRFARYRHRNTAYVVGIAMNFVYMDETDPSPVLTDSPASDAKTKVTYIYDLELDQNFRIIGGEWYQKKHPDFLFVPLPNVHAQSVADRQLNQMGDTSYWDGTRPVPSSWSQVAPQASRKGQPLARVVETLVQLSNTFRRIIPN